MRLVQAAQTDDPGQHCHTRSHEVAQCKGFGTLSFPSNTLEQGSQEDQSHAEAICSAGRSRNALATVLSSPVNRDRIRSQQRHQDKELLQQLWQKKQEQKNAFWLSSLQEHFSLVQSREQDCGSYKKKNHIFLPDNHHWDLHLAKAGKHDPHSPLKQAPANWDMATVLDTQLLTFGEAGKRICKVKPLSGKGRKPHHSSSLSAWLQHRCYTQGSEHPSVNSVIYTEPKHTQGLPQLCGDPSPSFLSPHSLF